MRKGVEAILQHLQVPLKMSSPYDSQSRRRFDLENLEDQQNNTQKKINQEPALVRKAGNDFRFILEYSTALDTT